MWNFFLFCLPTFTHNKMLWKHFWQCSEFCWFCCPMKSLDTAVILFLYRKFRESRKAGIVFTTPDKDLNAISQLKNSFKNIIKNPFIRQGNFFKFGELLSWICYLNLFMFIYIFICLRSQSLSYAICITWLDWHEL